MPRNTYKKHFKNQRMHRLIKKKMFLFKLKYMKIHDIKL